MSTVRDRPRQETMMLLIPLMMLWLGRPISPSPVATRRTVAIVMIVLTGFAPPDLGGLVGDGPWSHRFAAAAEDVSAAPPSSPADANDAGWMPAQRPGKDAAQKASPSEKRRFRDGTLFPSITGRVVADGRQWLFKPDRPSDEAAAVQPVPQDEPAAEGLLSRTEANPLETLSAQEQSQQLRRIPQIVLVENLMLQRIIEAIRDDPSDDRWTLQGVVTEFFDDNRLIVRQATRASQ